LKWGPAFRTMNSWPSSSNVADMTFPYARFTEMTFERLKIEARKFIASSACVSNHKNGVILGIDGSIQSAAGRLPRLSRSGARLGVSRSTRPLLDIRSKKCGRKMSGGRGLERRTTEA
jgi:hypothetical protein